MFHHIRNSLRQDEGKIPKPIAVSLHNVMTSVGGRDTNDTTWFRRPKHEVALLPLLKLEVLVASTEQYDMEQETTSRVVYTSPSPLRSVQPTWEHLEEKIALAGEWWRGAIYKSMTLRITQMLEDGSYALFLEAPLHPSKLERLQDTPKALPPNALIIDFSDGSTRCTSSMFQIYSNIGWLNLHPWRTFLVLKTTSFRRWIPSSRHRAGREPSRYRHC